ncbi:hypothetical protein FACS1894152_0510 [Bacilli bacterium]|nr:hypothetical protein FACS1894152_0510 [Bacilli bacterium]
MKYLTIKKDLKISQLAMGCMRFANSTADEMEIIVKAALDNGINFFDHADIYGNGKCEELFGHVLTKHPD